jgi:Ni/Co efflux regulator RcnB
MRRTVSLVLGSFLALSSVSHVAMAQHNPPPTTRPGGPLPPQVVGRPTPSRPVTRPPHFFRPGVHHRWVRGNHLWHWNHYRRVDWRRHPFLHRPPPGHFWVFVDGRYLLVRESSGFVVSVHLGR